MPSAAAYKGCETSCGRYTCRPNIPWLSRTAICMQLWTIVLRQLSILLVEYSTNSLTSTRVVTKPGAHNGLQLITSTLPLHGGVQSLATIVSIHRESKKGATLIMAITLSILHIFAKFFHCCKEQ